MVPRPAADGAYQGTITGYDATTIYIWSGARARALRLGPSSALRVDGRHADVWGLSARAAVTATVHSGAVVTLEARRQVVRPLVASLASLASLA